MNIAIYLADFAQVGPRGKLTAVGMGWAKTVTPLPAHSVVVMLEPDESDVDVEQSLDLRLLDSLGNEVADSSGKPIEAHVELSINRELDTQVSSITPLVLALGGGLPLEPDRYTWEVTSQGHPETSWSRSFLVMKSEPTEVDQS